MKALSAMQVFWDQWTAYLATCWTLPINATVCKPLWSSVATGSMAVGALLLFWTAWKIIDYRFKYKAALRAEAHRQSIAPEEEMKKIRWTGDDDPLDMTGKADVDVAASIRDELDRRKLQERGMLPRGPKT